MKRFAIPLWTILCLLAPAGIARAAVESVVTFNEIHYHPADAAEPEWIELHNQMAIRVDLGGWTLRGGVTFTFPENTVIEPGAHLVISSSPGVPAGALGPFQGRLDNKGEEIRLHERHGRLMDRLTYGDREPWPEAADGAGFTLAKRHGDLLSDAPANWTASAQPGGTPGAENFPVPVETAPRAVFPRGTAWKWMAEGGEPPPGWTDPGFNAAAWASGQAPFSTVATPAPATPLPEGRAGYYFRQEFAWTGGIARPGLLLTGALRGKAVFFLNGTALRSAEGAGEFAITLPARELQPGAAVLAVSLQPESAGGAAELDLALTLIDIATGVKPAPTPHVAGPVVINEISYHTRPVYADPQNGVEFAENPEEWLELFNRSETAVDLGGWRLDGGPKHVFPAGTVLPPGGFLVVDNTRFTGSLKNSGDVIRLWNAANELVDEARYFDSGRWPRAADGGGSTLELVDPAADNRVAESWAASDESGKSEWQTVTYRATGAEPSNSNNPSQWREFLFGLLDEGECLIDDVSVVEDPDGAKIQLIRNGTFEGDAIGGGAAHWRLLGTHKLSHVTQDPDNPGGKVLRLVATGELEHTYNNASTTLVNNRVISSQKTYEISYRAKWLSGSPQLNSRLYWNRAARTTILKQPATAGTPGAPNSRRVENAGPVFENLRHSPLTPAAGQPVRVSVNVRDPDGVREARLFHRVGAGAWQSVLMGAAESGDYFAVLPGQAQNTQVQFYIRAEDGRGAVSFFPKEGPDSRAIYKTGDGGVSGQPVRNKMRLYMNAADAAELHNPIHSVSNFRWPCTVIYNDREVWYDARVRLRSSPYGRQGNRAGWNIHFGGDALFRGAQKSVVIDGAYNMPATDGSGWLENGLGPSVNEMLYQAIARRAGDIPCSFDDVVYFQAPRAQEGNRRAQLKMTRYGSGYLEELMPDGEDTALFKLEVIYYPTSTVDGKPDSLKNAYTSFLDTEIRSLGNSKDNYRFNWLPQNHLDRDDFSGVIALARAFDSSQASLAANTAAAMDVENWMRVYALNVLTGLADTYNNGLAHNIVIGIRPRDGRAMLFPWDQDHAFYFAPTFSIFGGGTHRLAAVLNLPANRRRYCAHLLDLCENAFTNEYLDPIVTHLTSVAGKPSQHATLLKNWIGRRRTYVRAQIRTLYPPVEFAVTTRNGENHDVASHVTTLEGTGSIDVRNILVARNGGPASAMEVSWLDGRRWRLTLPLLLGPNAFTLTALDSSGAAIGSDSVTIFNIGEMEAATAENLTISEIHYHPANGDPGGEFIELMNVGAAPVSLEGARFTAGIEFDFTGSAVTSLPPGGRVLVVENKAAFLAKHGASAPVAGEFSSMTKLSNGGERLTLVDRGGAVIADFEYGTSGSWPEETDGGGFSLTLIRPRAGVDLSNPENWRASVTEGGSPGGTDALAADGFSSLTEYALAAPPEVFADGGGFRVVWRERAGADEARVVPEVSADLTNWLPDPGDGSRIEIPPAVRMADGARSVTALPRAGARFFRLRLERR